MTRTALKADEWLPFPDGVTVEVERDAEKSVRSRAVYAVYVNGDLAGYVVGFRDPGHATLWGATKTWDAAERHAAVVPSYRTRAQAAERLTR